MAERAQRVCRLNGCNVLTRSSSGYCEAHERGHRREKGDHKKADPFYTTGRWVKVSRWYRNGHPLCEMCDIRVSVLVHHKVEIKDDGDLFLEDNLMALCQECHNAVHHGKGGGRS